MALTTEQQRKANLRLGLVLGGLALLFALGFVAKMLLLGG